MRRSIWLLLPYETAVAGYAGWRGGDLWKGWGIWVLGLAPLALAVYVVAHELRRQRSLKTALIASMIPVVACVWIALCTLGLAWMMAGTAQLWSSPALRAGIGAGVTALVFGFVLFSAERRRTARQTIPSEPDPTGQPQ
jgi:uncharacterized membrane protein